MEEIVSRETIADISSDKFAVGSVPTVFYIPDYVTAAEEDHLLNTIYKAPISKWKSLKNRRLQNWGGVVHQKGLLPQDLPPWLKKVTSRIFEESRLFPSAINHVLINEYQPGQGIMPHQDGPAYVPVVAILSLGSPVVMDFAPHFRFENVTDTSENKNGDLLKSNNDGSSPVEKSSGEQSNEHRPFSVALMPRSLLIFKDMAYSEYLHGIKDCADQRYDEAVNVTSVLSNCDSQVKTASSSKTRDGEGGGDTVIHRTSTRVSLTCRLVTKVHKHLIKL